MESTVFDFAFASGESIFRGNESDEERAAKLEARVRKLGFAVRDLRIVVRNGDATVSGSIVTREERENRGERDERRLSNRLVGLSYGNHDADNLAATYARPTALVKTDLYRGSDGGARVNGANRDRRRCSETPELLE